MSDFNLPSSLFGLAMLILMFGDADSVTSGDTGDRGDITIGDRLRLIVCNGRLDGVSERC